MQFHKAIRGQRTCVHATSQYNGEKAIACGKYVGSLAGQAHGFLCVNHYFLQQRSVPRPVIKRQEVSYDDLVIASIIATDTREIAAALEADKVTITQLNGLHPAAFVCVER